MADYIACWDSFARFLAFQVERSGGDSDIYFASESLMNGEPVSVQRQRLRTQAQRWSTGTVPIGEREVRPVKIGRCSRDPALRLQEVQVGNYRPLFEICVIPVYDAVLVERELHRAYVGDHLRGEWYALSPIIHQTIGFLMEVHESTARRARAV